MKASGSGLPTVMERVRVSKVKSPGRDAQDQARGCWVETTVRGQPEELSRVRALLAAERNRAHCEIVADVMNSLEVDQVRQVMPLGNAFVYRDPLEEAQGKEDTP